MFLLRRNPGEHHGAIDGLGQLRIAHGRQLHPAEEDLTSGSGTGSKQFDLPGNGLGSEDMVAGDHLDLNSSTAGTGMDGGDGFRSRRVKHALQAEKDQSLVNVGLGECPVVRFQRRAKANTRNPCSASLLAACMHASCCKGMNSPPSESIWVQRGTMLSTALT